MDGRRDLFLGHQKCDSKMTLPTIILTHGCKALSSRTGQPFIGVFLKALFDAIQKRVVLFLECLLKKTTIDAQNGRIDLGHAHIE